MRRRARELLVRQGGLEAAGAPAAGGAAVAGGCGPGAAASGSGPGVRGLRRPALWLASRSRRHGVTLRMLALLCLLIRYCHYAK